MRDRKSYYKNGKPVHERSYCAFLDILGFSDSILAATTTGSHDALLGRFQRIFQEQLAWFRTRHKSGLLYFKTFSDNILIGCPAYSWDMESEFGVMVEALGRYQLAMAREGFFIRGGLSLGPLFIDDDQVFGHALLEAYALESKSAVNPIVVLSRDAEANVIEHLKFYGDPKDSPQARVVLRGPDGRYFINYLSECIMDTGDELAIDRAALDDHRTQVESALGRCRRNPAVFAKYAWLAAYHNHFCDSVTRLRGFDKAFRIDEGHAAVRFGSIVDDQ